MGQQASSVGSKLKKFVGYGGGDGDEADIKAVSVYTSPFVNTRKIDEYRDQEGDQANEFYVQEREYSSSSNSRKRKSRVVIRKVPEDELMHVTEEARAHPAFRCDYPMVMCARQSFASL